MGTKITYLILLALLISNSGISQEKEVSRKGSFIGTTTFQYGIPTTNLVSSTNYLTFRGEVFLDNNITVAGTIDYSLPKEAKPVDISENHSLLFGINYHFIKNNWDNYIGFQPGISISTSACKYCIIPIKPKYVLSPLITSSLGTRYYLGSIFNVFASVTYSYGIRITNPTNLPLSEFKIAGGVGFNF